MRGWLKTPIGNRPPDAPSGGGGRGALDRFARGFQQGLIPTRGQAIVRGINPAAYLLGGIVEGVGDAVRGSGWFQRFRNRPPTPGGAETFGLGPDQAPAEVLDNFAWVDGGIRNGSSVPSRTPPTPQGNRVGAGRGTTIAQGPAAQAMFEGMRAAANESMMRSQVRNAMSHMFGGKEL
jgi:hypothetical protein